MTRQAGVYETKLLGRRRNIIVDYVDGEGEATTREIAPFALRGTVGATGRYKVTHIEARCLTAKARRTFRIDRVRAMADALTGEEISIERWLATLDTAEPVLVTSEPTERPTSDPQIEYVEVRRGPRWRWLIILLLVGYAIGRYRLIRWALRAAGQHWGLWL